MPNGFRLKKENYTAVAEFMAVSFERDLADFTAIFRTINADYLSAFKDAINQVKSIETSFGIQMEQKQVTQELYELAEKIYNKVLLLKKYTERAKIDIPTLSSITTSLKNKNIEGAVKLLREVMPYLSANKAKLTDMPDDFLEGFPEAISQMERLNIEQNKLINKKKQTNVNEKDAYRALYKFISEIADTGKTVYKTSIKRDEYTISKILRKNQISSKSLKKDETPTSGN